MIHFAYVNFKLQKKNRLKKSNKCFLQMLKKLALLVQRAQKFTSNHPLIGVMRAHVAKHTDRLKMLEQNLKFFLL